MLVFDEFFDPEAGQPTGRPSSARVHNSASSSMASDRISPVARFQTRTAGWCASLW
jgi:hypothetical protein